MKRKEGIAGRGNGNMQKNRGEAARSKSHVGDGKISMPMAASPYTGITKKAG